MGFPQIGYQAFKLLAHQRLHEAVSRWKEKYPGVDIILIEPDPNDELMFETNILNFTRRVEIARHGFESVTLKLASDYDELKAVCAKHGIEISATRVRKVVRKFAEEREQSGGLAAHPRADHRRALLQAVRRRLAATAAVQPSAISSARSSRSVAGVVAHRRAHVVVRAERPAGRHDHALVAQPVGQLRARHAVGALQPDEVRLARVGVHRQVAQRLEQPRALARHRLAPALDLGVAACAARAPRPPGSAR